MFARPVTTNVSSYGPPGFVLEVDRYGGTIRTNIEDEFVVATNHFIKYGVNEETDPSSDKYSPWLNFDVPVVSPGSKLVASRNCIKCCAFKSSGKQDDSRY